MKDLTAYGRWPTPSEATKEEGKERDDEVTLRFPDEFVALAHFTEEEGAQHQHTRARPIQRFFGNEKIKEFEIPSIAADETTG
ncbi:hypothetical protein MRS44_018095 [Fusarium solani]|uniref:uncharacterized protein n=1 Tax=Fusarium solani TaxID=169388 RepID=UPI0032C436D4|nr:hypothetical protein MRS44_018095 [Fusarium solani]